VQSFQIQYIAKSNTNRHNAIIRNTVRIAKMQDENRNTIANSQFQFTLLQSQQNAEVNHNLNTSDVWNQSRKLTVLYSIENTIEHLSNELQ
jgi:hypothetical protein